MNRLCMGRFVDPGFILASNNDAPSGFLWLAGASAQNADVQQLQRFLEGVRDSHNALFWVQIIPMVLLVGYMLQRYLLGLTTRPKFSKQDVVYQEYFASGSSYKNFLTKIGGASNCLRLVVTDKVLWVTSWFPFSLFAALYDLEHVIPIQNLRSVEGTRTLGVQSLLLTYTDGGGKSHTLRIKPKNTAAFLDAVQAHSTQKGTSIAAVNVVPEEPIPRLGLALKRYWHHLIGMGLFPTAVMVSDRYLHLPFPVFIPVFFAVACYGFWPIITKRVPFTYQFVMGAVWLGGAVFGGLVMSLLSVFTGQHP